MTTKNGKADIKKDGPPGVGTTQGGKSDVNKQVGIIEQYDQKKKENVGDVDLTPAAPTPEKPTPSTSAGVMKPDQNAMLKDVDLAKVVGYDKALLSNAIATTLSNAITVMEYSNMVTPLDENLKVYKDQIVYGRVVEGIPRVFDFETLKQSPLMTSKLNNALIGATFPELPQIQGSIDEFADGVLRTAVKFNTNITSLQDLGARSFFKYQTVVTGNSSSQKELLDYLSRKIVMIVSLVSGDVHYVAQPNKFFASDALFQITTWQDVLDTNTTRFFVGDGKHLVYSLISTPADWFKRNMMDMFRRFPIRFGEAEVETSSNKVKVSTRIYTATDQVAAELQNINHEFLAGNQINNEVYKNALQLNLIFGETLVGNTSNYEQALRRYNPLNPSAQNSYMLRMFIDVDYRQAEFMRAYKRVKAMGVMTQEGHALYTSSLETALSTAKILTSPEISMFSSIIASKVDVELLAMYEAYSWAFDFNFELPPSETTGAAILVVKSILTTIGMFPQIYFRNPPRILYLLFSKLQVIIQTTINRYLNAMGWRVERDENGQFVRVDDQIRDMTLREYQEGQSVSFLVNDVPRAYPILTRLKALLNQIQVYDVNLDTKRTARYPYMLNDYTGVTSHDEADWFENSMDTALTRYLGEVSEFVRELTIASARNGQLGTIRNSLKTINAVLDQLQLNAVRDVSLLMNNSYARLQKLYHTMRQGVYSERAGLQTGSSRVIRFTPQTVHPESVYGADIPLIPVNLNLTVGVTVLMTINGYRERLLGSQVGTQTNRTFSHVVTPLDSKTIVDEDMAEFTSGQNWVNAWEVYQQFVNPEGPGNKLGWTRGPIASAMNAATAKVLGEYIGEKFHTDIISFMQTMGINGKSTDPRITAATLFQRDQQNRFVPNTQRNDSKFGTKFFSAASFIDKRLDVARRLVVNPASVLNRRSRGVILAVEQLRVLNPYQEVPNTRFLVNDPILLTQDSFTTRQLGGVPTFCVVVNGNNYDDFLHEDLRNRVFQVESLVDIPEVYSAMLRNAYVRGHIAIKITDVVIQYQVNVISTKRTDKTTSVDATNLYDQMRTVLKGQLTPVTYDDTTQADLLLTNQAVLASFMSIVRPVVPLADDNILRGIYGEVNPPDSYMPPNPDNWCVGRMVAGVEVLPLSGVPKREFTTINFNNSIRVVNNVIDELPNFTISQPDVRHYDTAINRIVEL